VRSALAGDRAAFGRLVDRHRPLLMRLGHRKLADDVYYAALAVRLGVPIYVDTTVMARAGLAPDGLARELGEGWQPVDGQAVFQPAPQAP
jgi:hypothetical protein